LVSPESPRLDVTPPLLAIACEMPDESSIDSSELSTSSPLISTFDELISKPFKFSDAPKLPSEYRAMPEETDFFGHPTTPPHLPTSISLPGKRLITPPPSPAANSPSPVTYRPRGESDPSGTLPEFVLDAEAAVYNHSVSTPSSPNQEVVKFSSSLSASLTTEEEVGRARALSTGDACRWSDEFALEQTNVEDPWTIFSTLEEENTSRGFQRQAISSPSISLHSSAPISVPHSHNQSSHNSRYPTSSASSSSSSQHSKNSLPSPEVPEHASSAPSPSPSKSTSKLQKLFAKFKFLS